MITWFLRLISGEAHFYIGGTTHPYMKRWFLIPRNRWLNIYLHKFIRDDDDRALHDHPWWFISLMIWGSYFEWTQEHTIWPSERLKIHAVELVKHRRRAWSIAFRHAEARHRVTLDNGKPCWTLVVTGRKVREWGFWCPRGFVVWDEFCKPGNKGEIGKGCGD